MPERLMSSDPDDLLDDIEIKEEMEEEAEIHEFGALNTLLFVVVLVMSILLAFILKEHRCYYLSETAAVLLVGVAVGLAARVFFYSQEELDFLYFQPELFYFLLLPPIIFDAGYTCRRKHFFQNFLPIILYAVLGTFVSTFIIGYGTYAAAKLGWIDGIGSDPIEALLFGAMISAVNPVATLSLMGTPELNCDPLLYSLVFGESVLNDAVSIVLFHTFMRFYENGQSVGDGMLLLATGSFILTSLGSVATGVLIGLACSYFCKHTDIGDHPHLELSMLFLFAYGSYAFAESLELSGIMALFFCGIILAHYNSYNLSPVSRDTAEVMSKSLAQIAEYFVFLYMGMGFFTGSYTHWNASFILFAIILCLVSRLFNTFPLTIVANLRRSPTKKISVQMQVVIWFAGLRGAIAFTLSQTMPLIHREVYTTTTLGVIIFYTVVCGGLTEPLLRATGMRLSTDRDGVDRRSSGEAGNGSKGGGKRYFFSGREGEGGDNDESEDEDGDDESTPLNIRSIMDAQKEGGSAARAGMSPYLEDADKANRGLSRTARQYGTKRRSGGLRAIWRNIDEIYIKPTFGGSSMEQRGGRVGGGGGGGDVNGGRDSSHAVTDPPESVHSRTHSNTATGNGSASGILGQQQPQQGEASLSSEYGPDGKLLISI